MRIEPREFRVGLRKEFLCAAFVLYSDPRKPITKDLARTPPTSAGRVARWSSRVVARVGGHDTDANRLADSGLPVVANRARHVGLRPFRRHEVSSLARPTVVSVKRFDPYDGVK